MEDLRTPGDGASKTQDDELSRWQEMVTRWLDLLRRSPKPDTFLGRKTQEPFPKEDDE